MKIKTITYSLASPILLSFYILSGTAVAGVSITQDMSHMVVDYQGETVRIERIQNQKNRLTGGFSKTSRKCPPFCIQPMIVAPGVNTYGELEVIKFIEDNVKTAKGLLIDARTPSWHAKGTIPGSVNIPFTTFAAKHNSEKLIAAMKNLGVTHRTTISSGFWTSFKAAVGIGKKQNPHWDFSSAKELLLWCNGMWCGQSPRAIHGLIKHGYPTEKLHYYRAGMQGWQILGLTTVSPK